MTRAELRALVILHTGRTDKADLINSSFDLAKGQIQQVHDFGPVQVESSALTLLTDTSTVILPPDVFELIDPVILTDPANSQNVLKIDLKSKKWALENDPPLGVGITGYPSYCFVETDGTLKFVPGVSQDWTVKINYFQKQGVASGDAEVIQAGLENVMVEWCTHYVYSSIQMYTDADAWMKKARASLALAVQADDRTDDKKSIKPFSQTNLRNTDLIPSGQNPYLGSEGY